MNASAPSIDAEARRFTAFDWMLLVVTAGMWGASFLFMDIALDAFDPGLITLLRVGFGCATLWMIPYQRTTIDSADWPRVGALGVVWMALPLTMFPIAQQWIDSSLTGMLNGGMPVFAVLVGVLAFGAPVVATQLLGVAIGLVGIVLIGLPEASTAGTTALGVGLVVFAIMSYGVAINIAGPLQRAYGALPVLRRALAVAVALTLPFGLIDATQSSFDWGPLAACLALGIGGTGLAYVTMSVLAGRTGAVRACMRRNR